MDRRRPRRSDDVTEDGHDDDDDDDQIVVVSCTRQRWEKLHGIKATTSADVGGSNLADAVDGAHGDDDDDGDGDDDEVIMVTTVTPAKLSSPPFWRFRQRARDVVVAAVVELRGGFGAGASSALVGFGLALLLPVAVMFWRRRCRRGRGRPVRSEGGAARDDDGAEDDARSAVTAVATCTEVTRQCESVMAAGVVVTPSGSSTVVATTTTTRTSMTTETESTSVAAGTSHDGDRDNAAAQDRRTEESTDPIVGDDQLSPSLAMSLSRRQQLTVEDHNKCERLQMVHQLVRDIKLAKDVLEEHSLDPSLAPQLAVTLHVVESERELQYQRALLDDRHRRLDRGLSERQHQERMQAVRYDPNWREKVEMLRRRCWTFSTGVPRLGWEVFWIHQMSRGGLPMLVRWCRHYYRNGGEGGTWGNSFVATEGPLREMAWAVLAEVCGCRGPLPAGGTDYNRLPSSVLTATLPPSTGTATGTFTLPPPSSTATYVVAKALFRLLPLERLSCYGYCLAAGSFLLVSTMLLHQGFRALSLPVALHHALNVTAAVAFLGPHRTLHLCFVTYGSNYGTDDPTDARGKVGPSTTGPTTVLLLLLLLLLPLATWAWTRRVHLQVVSDVEGAERFEEAYLRGQSRLERTFWELTLFRYACLAVYSATILWHEVS